MKKTLLIAVLALGAMTANAQQAILEPGFFQNWSLGIDGGVTTPMHHHAFFGDMRALVGLDLKKQITPTFGLGVEGQFGINTSSWKAEDGLMPKSKTAFDNSYVGTFGTVDLCNLFGGYNCGTRGFSVEAMAGAGWGHDFFNSGTGQKDVNYFATKVGLNFNINCSEYFTVAIKPSVMWNMNGQTLEGKMMSGQSPTNYNINHAYFNLQAGLIFHLGGNGFECTRPYNQAEIDALNAQINDLRLALEACMVNSAAWEAKAADLANQLQACLNRKPEVKEVVKQVDNNTLTSVRYVFFKIGSSVITNDQMPNVEMIASYLKNNKDAKVDIKGYASQDGPLDVNIRLAQARAESVKNALINKYGISASRISAEGQGIGHMFKEETWNRVSICMIED